MADINNTTETVNYGKANLLRAGAIALWVAGFTFEFLAFLIFMGKINILLCATSWQLVAVLTLDIACVAGGSQLWKKANDSEPSDPNRKINYWMRKYLRTIALDACFFPLAFFDIISKTVDKRAKKVAYVVVAVLLIALNIINLDPNPVTQQQKDEAKAILTENVYWTAFGKIYHTNEDCSALNQYDKLTSFKVEHAFAANHNKLCAVCAETDGITGVATAE